MMHDREKVINCLNDIEQIMATRQEICPQEELQYWIELQEGVADAIALLKAQKAQKFLVDENGKITPLPVIVRCKDCKHAEILKWLDGAIVCKKHNYTGVRPEEFFCADGE